MTRHLTPPEFAKERRISSDKVLLWIKSGELAAVNVATNPNGRPRWIISEEAIRIFEARRAAITKPATTARRRSRLPEVKSYV